MSLRFNMKKFSYILLSLIMSMTILIGLLVLLSSSNTSYFFILDKTSSFEEANLEIKDYNKSVVALADYMAFKRDNIDVSVDGENIFKEQEVFHMFEVKNIFRVIRYLFVALTIIVIVALYRLDRNRILRGQFYVTSIILVFLIISFVFFDKAFLLMHKIMFNNDYWLFTSEAYLTRILTGDFFLYFLGLLIFLYVSLSLLLYTLTRPWRKNA
ncbi:MAG: hypothetical protein CSB16_01585 [Clostridiales bacterium]|nr:MAG: hypothetical protein CSB16_01585 [Clostridiales bacterium]